MPQESMMPLVISIVGPDYRTQINAYTACADAMHEAGIPRQQIIILLREIAETEEDLYS